MRSYINTINEKLFDKLMNDLRYKYDRNRNACGAQFYRHIVTNFRILQLKNINYTINFTVLFSETLNKIMKLIVLIS